MSRIGRMPVLIPQGVKVSVADQQIKVEGPKGSLTRNIHPEIKAEVKEGKVLLTRSKDDKLSKSLHGLFRALTANMVLGVTQGFSKKLEIEGVGYRANVEGKKLMLTLGFSHVVEMPIPEGITIQVEKQVSLTISGIDKELVGQVAANIRFLKEPEPYRGKGIRYADEHIRRKVGKAAATATAGGK